MTVPGVGRTGDIGAVVPKYTARRAEYPPGAHFGPRLLNVYELVWLTAGSATWSRELPGASGPIQVSLQSGDVVLARPGGTDSIAWSGARQSVHGYLHFLLPEAVRDETERWPLVRSGVPGGLLESLCRYLLRISADGGSAALPVTASATRVLLDLFIRGEAPRRGEASAPVRAALTVVRAIWESDRTRSVSLGELADATGVSVGHLSRSASRDLGHGLTAALEMVRLGEAAVRLQRTDQSVNRIARESGFVSPYHFSRRFARAYGMPPGRFRRLGAADDPLGPLAAADLLWLWTVLHRS